MSGGFRTVRLIWPREVSEAQVAAGMQLVAATGGTPLILDALGRHGKVQHCVRVAEGRAASLTTQLRQAIPGLGVEGVSKEEAPPIFTRAIELRLSTARRPLQAGSLDVVSRALLAALAHVGRDEALLLQWVLRSPLSPTAVPNDVGVLHDESFVRALLKAPFQVPKPADADTRSAMRAKREPGGWKAIGRIAVQAATRPRQEQLLRGVLQALRTTEGPSVRITARSINPNKLHSLGSWSTNTISISRTELTTLCAWPVGTTAQLPVIAMGSRRLPAAASVARFGRIVGDSTWPGKARPLALSAADALRHLHVLGPTGTGKSTLLLNLIEQDMRDGRAVVVIEPKGDLIHDVLARVPERRHADVIVLDPTEAVAPVGLNPLAASNGRSPELAADQLLATFHGLYAAYWGPRTSDILHASLLTLARTPGMSLAALPLLLGDAAFRRRIVGRLNDPLGLGPFWASFEAWSEAERTTAVAPVMNKLRPFLMRPSLRRIVGQAEPKLNLRDIFTARRILLVNLAKGASGAEAASLLGALVLAGLWQHAQERSLIAPERRHPVFVYIDEFQDYLHLPTDLGDALAQARSLGIGFVLAHQHLAQLTPTVRAGVLANARSRICFQLGTDDAKTMATSSPLLDAEDFASLERYHFYTQLVAEGAVQPWCSGKSMAPSKQTSSPEQLRRASRERYGRPTIEIDAALEQLISNKAHTNGKTASGGSSSNDSATPADDLAPKRRRGTGGAA